MGIGKYRGYQQNIGNIALIGDISLIQGKIWPYPPITVSIVENTNISADISFLFSHAPSAGFSLTPGSGRNSYVWDNIGVVSNGHWPVSLNLTWYQSGLTDWA
ncbi:unnamed protein product [Prunus armeniaca]